MTEHDDELDAMTRRLEAAEAENARLLASLREEQRQRRAIQHALGAPDDAESPDGSPRGGVQPGEPIDLVALHRPEDLPAGYLFRVLRYGLEQIDGASGLCERVCGGAP